MRLTHYLFVGSMALLLGACAAKKTGLNHANLDNQYENFGGNENVSPGSAGDFQVNVGDRIFFSLDQVDLAPDACQTLERQAAWLKQYGEVRITVEGHTDERGTREYNIALGQKRAEKVKTYLVSLGVLSNRIDTVSYGKDRPQEPLSEESAYSKNRRAVSVITAGLH